MYVFVTCTYTHIHRVIMLYPSTQKNWSPSSSSSIKDVIHQMEVGEVGGGSGGSGGSSGGGGSGGGGAASTIVEGMRSRLSFATNDNDVLGLIRDSIDNWRTKQYDWFQQRTNNISM